MNNKIDSLKKTKDADKLAEAVRFKNDSLILFKNKLFSIAKENPWSWVALLNVYQNAETFTPTELAHITKIFTKDVMATPKGLKLSKYQQQSGILISGAKFPYFTYKDINRNLVSLDKARGKNGTLVIFWASWCGPCRAEIPEFKKLYAKYKNKGINFISISTDHDLQAWKQALKTETMPWQNVSNLPGNNDDIYRRYNVSAIPAVFLLNSKNEIVMPNEYRVAEIRDHLEKLQSAIIK
jgi:thiol-disulfide isomerase/thioredoxin